MGDIANTISPQDRATLVAFYQLSANPEAEFDLCARYQRMSVFYALYFKLNGKVKLMLTKEENHDQSSLMAIAGTKQELDDTQDNMRVTRDQLGNPSQHAQAFDPSVTACSPAKCFQYNSLDYYLVRASKRSRSWFRASANCSTGSYLPP
jgi:hypothetical protein